MLAHGFARVLCESGKDELLVAFSCKGRGVCPSCNAKRAQVTAVHLVERVLRIRTMDDVLRGLEEMSGSGHPWTDVEES